MLIIKQILLFWKLGYYLFEERYLQIDFNVENIGKYKSQLGKSSIESAAYLKSQIKYWKDKNENSVEILWNENYVYTSIWPEKSEWREQENSNKRWRRKILEPWNGTNQNSALFLMPDIIF